ncbi:peptidoglycan -binding protein [Roseospira marina]|uniref:Peptidoglycan-binding protein n=2 Tax=Roseospira marina TaxID=140057 RepID=A0A5M6IIH2_9PROT|nr:peptidoglycan -binding protein [Roseospira marina]
MGQALSGRDAALDRLRDRIAEYEDQLALERQDNADLRASVVQLSGDLQAANARWESLIGTARASEATELELAEALDLVDRQRQRIGALQEDQRSLSERLRDALGSLDQREADLEEAYATIAADKETIESRVADLARLESQIADLKATRERLRQELEAANHTISADKETIETTLAEMAQLRQDVEALTALRSQLEARIRDMDATLGETEGALADQERISEQARAQAALLNEQLKRVRAELARLGDLLDAREVEAEAQRATIANLGERLNTALASRVQELQRYRSEFFGRLREVLGDREGIRVEGDRFVFQSEVLFGVGEATLGPAGRDDLAHLADTLMSIAQQFPAEIDWILRVDGHTDKRPIHTAAFANNWELSTARAISVVRFLIDQGVPPARLAAAGFAEYRPVAEGDTEEAYARNRRIELKLDQR